ncbi:hypothetical protein GCM10011383_42210 [Hymenobacter cavernae]|uniref:Outer membrane protein beta-barrel domain-containing protein n=1 Tax=Hymenobacter cavernae TaxID=2044852 RepID=A0ABQ1UVG9_9BACT|nr:hypothetical protein GCM10011383_42210 [Hymenobacter cavernae]
MLYIRKGFQLSTPSFTAQTSVRLHYLNLPLLAKIKAGGLVLEAGPQLGYLLSLRDYNPTLTLREQRSVDPYQRWELGYAAGISYELRNGLGIGARYNAGLTNVRQAPNRIRNASFQLHLSYLVARR